MNEIDKALKTCFTYLFNNNSNDSSNNKKNSIQDILTNKIPEKYVHYYPFNLSVKLTSNCNLRCKHCYFFNKPKAYSCDGEMSKEQMFEQIRYFVEEVNIINCTLTGGEIFTYPHLFEFLKYLKANNVPVMMLSNATMITEEVADELAKTLNLDTDVFQISLEGSSEDINDAIRGKGVYNKVVQGIRYLTDRNFKVAVSYTIKSQNVNELESLYDLVKNLGCKAIILGRMRVSEDSQKELVPTVNDMVINIAKLIKKIEMGDNSIQLEINCLKAFDFLNYPMGIQLLDNKLQTIKDVKLQECIHCHPHDDKVTLFPNGELALCYGCSENKELILGNICEKSFDDIWQNRFSNAMFQKRNLMETICRFCDYVALCGGACPLNAYATYKTINAPDDFCQYAPKLYEKYGDKNVVMNDNKMG